MSLFPIFVKLDGRLVVVVGGGAVAEQKIPGLFAANARVRVVAPEVSAQIRTWVAAGKIDWHTKHFEPSDLQESFLVIAATAAPGVNEAVFREAESRHVLCNAVDDIANCHFYYGAVVQRGDLQLAISTNGKSPALAQRLRKELEAQYGEEYGAWLDWLGTARELLRANSVDQEKTKSILHQLASRENFERFRQQLAASHTEKGAA